MRNRIQKNFQSGIFHSCFLFNSLLFLANIYAILVVLIVASIGVAMVEPVGEAYFFDILQTKKEELRFYSPYTTTVDVSHFIGRISATIVLFFLPFKFLFLLFALFMLILFLVSTKMKNIVEFRKDGKSNR